MLLDFAANVTMLTYQLRQMASVTTWFVTLLPDALTVPLTIPKGVERWMGRLDHAFHAEFQRAISEPFKTASGEHVGDVRIAGPGSGNVTFIRIFDAGCVMPSSLYAAHISCKPLYRHMTPYDQPEASLVRDRVACVRSKSRS